MLRKIFPRFFGKVLSTQSRLGIPATFSRSYALDLAKVRNIGISAHIDSGKTTLTERILFYTGRIKAIHEVKGKDEVGAKMDSMELEREKGITIQSAATYCRWGDKHINIIDTPGHVDFTIEVERALRVLDGAVLVLCSVGGVQSQTLTVTRQMNRYKVARVAFINKLDRAGADPMRVIGQIRSKLGLHAAAVQIPIGLSANFEALIDLVEMKAYRFEGPDGEKPVEFEIPAEYKERAHKARQDLLANIGEVDDEIMECVVEEKEPSVEVLKAAIRRTCIARKFIPVFMGSAFKNKGVQLLLNGVGSYLPAPNEVDNYALDISRKEEKVPLESDHKKPFVGLAFKLEDGPFGQLTYLRVYQGTLEKGVTLNSSEGGKPVKISRLVRMHSNEMEEISSIGPGDICAIFGIDCATGTTFTDKSVRYSMESMHVPSPVISLSITPKNRNDPHLTKALAKFQKEDPTFRVDSNPETNETIISGMGELHLDIYVERMRREFNIEVSTGQPKVNFRETVLMKGEFDTTLKKQTGGAGQYARVAGYLEPVEGEPNNDYPESEFLDETIGGSIPPEYMEACRKGFMDTIREGPLLGFPIIACRMALNDGAHHAVDSSEKAFRTAVSMAFRDGMKKAQGVLLEPIMKVEIDVPSEFQGNCVSAINKRKGLIEQTDQSGEMMKIEAAVSLNNMFGFSSELRSLTQGKGEFAMVFDKYQPVSRDFQQKMLDEKERAKNKK